MRLNFKKISALATSALMIGMTMGGAMAANYPAPFIDGGVANVAIVYGTGDGVSTLDLIEAGNIQSNLQSHMSGTTGSDASISGEAYALFTSSKNLYMNDSLYSIKSSLTDTQLPTVLADSDFEGNINSDITQKIVLNSNPRIVYGNHPDSNEDDPVVAIQLGTTVSDYIYNASITFAPSVNLSSSDSIGESLNLFGQRYTIGAGTTNTTLYLYKSSETVDLSIGGTSPSTQTVTVEGETYDVELNYAEDDKASIKVTDSSGNSDNKEISEDASKKIQGIDIAVNYANEDANGVQIVEITIGADKLKLEDGNEIRVGSDEDIIDGTEVSISGAGWQSCSGFTIQVYEEDSDENAILVGESFVDPVFESFKIDFTALGNSDDREEFVVEYSGDDIATLTMTSHTGNEGTIDWYYNDSSAAKLADSSGNVINVIEGAQINESEYVIVGNEDNGYLLELTQVSNSSSATASDDTVEFKDVFSDKTYTADITDEGSGTISIEGEDYTVTYVDARSTSGDEYVRLDYPDAKASTTYDGAVIYPTFQSSKGANVALYEPVTITLTAFDGTTSLDSKYLRFPDGDGYTNVLFEYVGNETGDDTEEWNITYGETEQRLDTNSTAGVIDVVIGEIRYQIQDGGSANTTSIYLENPDDDTTAVDEPGILIFEEQDDSTSSAYNVVFVQMEGTGLSTNGVGVDDVVFSWGSDDGFDSTNSNELKGETDSDLYYSMDYYGTMVVTDTSESSQKTATISYPDNQVYVQAYIAEVDAAITAATSGTSGSSTPLGEVLVKDTEVGSVGTKNLVIVGGSCINSAAATLVGGDYCGSAWTDTTGVGSGEFLIKAYEGSSLTTNLALLVAGYNAADTVNAAKYLRTQTVDTSKHYKGTSSTSAELVTTSE